MLSTAPGPHSAGPAPYTDLREGGSPSPDISNITTTPLGFRGQSASYEAGRTTHNTSTQKSANLASTDPQPEARVNPRANTVPPSFEPPSIQQILESSPSFQSDSRAPTRSVGMSSDVDLPGFSPSPEIPDAVELPEPQIQAHCKADLTFHPSVEPDVEIIGGAFAPHYAQLAIDLTVNPPGPEPRKPKDGSPEQDNTVLILCGLVFVGLVVWLGNDEPSRGTVMPYY